jgi:hypothetical protein
MGGTPQEYRRRKWHLGTKLPACSDANLHLVTHSVFAMKQGRRSFERRSDQGARGEIPYQRSHELLRLLLGDR